MKKKLYILTAVILLLLVSFWGYIQYRKQISYQTKIHKKANILLKADVTELSKVIWRRKDSLDTKVKSVIPSIEIPANIFLYTVKDKKKTTWFGSVKIKNYLLFEEAGDKIFLKEKVNNIVNKYTSKDSRITIYYTKDRAAFSYSVTSEKTDDVLQDIVKQQNLTEIKNSNLKNIKNSKGLFVIYDGSNTGILNYNGNSIISELQLKTDKIKPLTEIQYIDTNPNNLASFRLSANIDEIIPKRDFNLQNFKIQTDSLLKYYNNGIQIEIGNSTALADTIITYEYNDDFERVEIQQIKENLVPEVSLILATKSNQFYNYLAEEEIIKNGKLANNISPLFQLQIYQSPGFLTFTTKKENVQNYKILKDNRFLYGRVDFAKIKLQKEYDSYKRYTNLFNEWIIEGTSDQKTMNIKTILTLTKPFIELTVSDIKPFINYLNVE